MTKNKKSIFSLGLLVSTFSVIALAIAPLLANAKDKIETSAKNAFEDTKTDTKKLVRKAKRKSRKVGKSDTGLKDLKDSADDRSDELNSSANKIKNKINE